MTDQAIPPYPSGTLAKGWRFEIDIEKVERSDTWLKAKTGAMRGALLLLWSKAWQQTPCGTLPNDDELVSLLIDMPPAAFEKNRAVLMRGFWLASDGRLYHDTIAERVLAMLDKRAGDAKRAATRRARAVESGDSPPEVPNESRVTTPGPTGEFDTKHQAPSTKKEPKEKSTAVPWMTVNELAADGLSEEVATAFLAHRRAKKAKLTAIAWAGFMTEVRKAGWAAEAAVLKAIARNWTGFEAEWVSDKSTSTAQTFKERDAANAAARVHEMTGGLVSAKTAHTTRRNDALQEVFDAPRLLG